MMESRQWLLAAGIAALAACGPGTPQVASTPEGGIVTGDKAQRVTRRIAAVPARIAAAAAQVFSENGIPVASSNEVAGTVTSTPIRVTANWGGQPTAERLNCGRTASGEPITAAGIAEVTVALEAKGTAEGSTTTLFATGKSDQGDQEGATGAEGCVLTTQFAARLLDEIERRAGGGMGAGAGQPSPVDPVSPMPSDTTSPMPSDTTAP